MSKRTKRRPAKSSNRPTLHPTLKLLRTLTPTQRRAMGYRCNHAMREALGQLLEATRLTKQNAKPKSAKWYDADADIVRIGDVLYAGRTIDPVEVLESHDGDVDMFDVAMRTILQSE